MRALRVVFAFLIAAALCVPAFAATYRVEVTNLTKNQQFTPLLGVSHRPAIALFEPGEAAIPELEIIAEDGNVGPLDDLLETLPSLVHDTDSNGGLTPPGETSVLYVESKGSFDRISLVAMLIPTNDTFVAVDSIKLPKGGRNRVVYALAYDAGTEANDQDCANIPGPPCFGAGLSAGAGEGDEGFVHVANGFHELGGDALTPAIYDWRNPVARVVISRVDDDESDDEGED